MFDDALKTRAAELLARYRKQGRKLAVAESCTGGLVSALLTEIPGSSDVFERGFITYSNESKTGMLGVDAALIEKHGAVSREVAEAMARGALTHSHADVAVSITGIAGPDGGTPEKPVGLVYLAVAAQEKIKSEECRFTGNRDAIRRASVIQALALLRDALHE